MRSIQCSLGMMMNNSIRQVAFGYGDVNGIITPLIPFNCIYDIDFGLVRFMYENGYTSNKDLIDPSFFDLFKEDTRKVILKLYSREEENPLKLFTKENVDADNLYVEFMKNCYKRIIRSSVHTGIYEICSEFKNEKSIKASILYSNEDEYYMLKDDPRLEGIDLIDLDQVNKKIKEFNLFFFKSIDDMYIDLFAKKIHSKAVYFLDYKYNFNKQGALKESVYTDILEVNRNILNIINVYDRSRLGMEE